MRELSYQQVQFLQSTYRERVNFDPRERRLYAHDVGTIPGILKRLTGSQVPAAVVQPLSQEELVKLAVWAQENRIPLIPRGKATSGYGGAVPVNGGVVVEFKRMNKVLELNVEEGTIAVQGGAVWQKIEEQLNENGLALNSYPTSAPASTVAGWLATGGAGIGSYQAGYFRDNVIEVTIVLPDGEVRVLSGEDLALVENVSGVSGFITSIKLKVRPNQPLTKKAFAFTDGNHLAMFIKKIYQHDVPLWSMSFINPQVAKYRNKMPPKPKHGSRVSIPEKFLLIAIYEESAHTEKQLVDLARRLQGEILEDSLAEHEWEERFNPMKAKRLSPSLIPAEVVVPVDLLEQVLLQLEERIDLPLLLEGLAVKGGEIVLLGFIPHDERKFGFNTAFGLSLSVVKAAIENGGRPYGCGLYFSGYAQDILGKAAFSKLAALTAEHDKNNIMNPGKTSQVQPIARLIKWGLSLEGLINKIANSFPGNPPGEIHTSTKGLPGDVTWYSYSCAQCGYCVDECTAYYGRGWESQSPRGKWSLLKMVANGETSLTQADASDFLKCTTCELCHEKCQLELPIEPSWFKLRGQLIQDQGFHSLPAFHIMEASARKERNIWAHYSKDRDAWVPDDIKGQIKERSEIAFFPGCTASFVEKDIAESTARLLSKAGIEYTYLGKEEACCGIPMLMAGKWDAFEEIMDHNTAAMKRRGVKTVITSCPACRLIWDTYYRRWSEDRGEEYPFQAKHYSEVIAEKIAGGQFKPEIELKRTVTYHDPCHMGRCSGVYDEPRELLKAIPGVDLREMKYNRDRAHCCGSVLTLVDNPDTAAQIGKVRLDEAVATGADTVITACPCCRVQLKVTADYYGMENLKVRDLATFVAEACGFDVPDSTPEIDSSWAIFDKMIRMLTPQGMAGMMAEMLDDMIDAMPGLMGAMMKWVKGMPPAARKAVIAMMKPVMPRLFPVLLPGMLPKLMPKMLAMVKGRISMPEFMQEQLPDLMPPAMADLIPKMLPDITPHFMPLMIDYLTQTGPQNTIRHTFTHGL